MNCSSSLKYNIVKSLLKIEINECNEDSHSFESFKGDLDYQSLHPNYEFKRCQIYKKKSKSCENKLSLQIENFIKSNFPGQAETRQNLENLSISSTIEQNQVEEIARREKYGKKKKNRCSSACVIG